MGQIMRAIKKIIVHCSASKFGDSAAIDRWHKERGWQGIGYHYVILNGERIARAHYNGAEDGELEAGRDEGTVGAHCLGHNADSLGICLIGDKIFTPAQLRTLGELIIALMKKYVLSPKDVYGHYEFEPYKTCPNLNMNAVRTALTEPEEPFV